MKAVIQQADKTVKVEDRPVPTVGPSQILWVQSGPLLVIHDSWDDIENRLKIKAVGINPTGELIFLGILKIGR